jgi:hypothetical protein
MAGSVDGGGGGTNPKGGLEGGRRILTPESAGLRDGEASLPSRGSPVLPVEESLRRVRPTGWAEEGAARQRPYG